MVRALPAGDGARPVVALARRPEAVPGRPGLTARFADYEDPGSLQRAFAGIETLVLVSSDGVAETMLRHHRHLVAAAAAGAGVEHVVYTSIAAAALDSGFYYAAAHRETEALLAASGIGHRLARTSIFSDFFASTWIAPALETGTLALPAGDARMSLVTRDDVARALTGPAALTADEICRISEAATGRRLRFEAIEEDEYRRRLAAARTPGWLVEAFSTMFAAVRQGRFGAVSPDVERLTGGPGQALVTFMR